LAWRGFAGNLADLLPEKALSRSCKKKSAHQKYV